MGGPFTILRFTEPDLDDVVYIEQLASALYLYKRSETCHYHQVMEQLRLQAEPAVYRHELRPVITAGGEVMDWILKMSRGH